MLQCEQSHDWLHIERVRRLAMSLARETQRSQSDTKARISASGSGSTASSASTSTSAPKEREERIVDESEMVDDDTLLIVELAALLHDIKDWKYSGSESAGADAAAEFLRSWRASGSGSTVSVPPAITDRVTSVISLMGMDGFNAEQITTHA